MPLLRVGLFDNKISPNIIDSNIMMCQNKPSCVMLSKCWTKDKLVHVVWLLTEAAVRSFLITD